MLKKIYRLGSLSLRSPKGISGAYFNLKTSRNNLEIPRFAFVVSKKTDKRSTQRNLLKRKLRSCVEEIFDKIDGGNDFIFYPKQLLASVERNLVLEEVKNVFAKQGFLKQ